MNEKENKIEEKIKQIFANFEDELIEECDVEVATEVCRLTAGILAVGTCIVENLRELTLVLENMNDKLDSINSAVDEHLRAIRHILDELYSQIWEINHYRLKK